MAKIEDREKVREIEERERERLAGGYVVLIVSSISNNVVRATSPLTFLFIPLTSL